MTDQPPSAIGTVAQEAARLIEDMAAMARLSYSPGDGPSPDAGAPAQEPVNARAPHPAGPADGEAPQGFETTTSSGLICTACGADRRDTHGDRTGADPTGGYRAGGDPSGGNDAAGADTSQNCRLCPLCRGIAMLRSVRPETVDMLADLATSVAASLRDVATRSRASDSSSSAGSTSGAPPDAGRAPVQDIPVDDESEG